MQTPKERTKSLVRLRRIHPYGYTWRFFNGSSWSSMTAKRSLYDLPVGQSNPRWKENVAYGSEAGSSYYRSVREKILLDPKVDWVWTQWANKSLGTYLTYRVTGSYPLHSLRTDYNFSVPDISALKVRAKVAFISKVREVNTPFQALPFLGELRETIGMLRHPLKGIARITDRYNRTVERNASQLSKLGPISDALTDMYLQWTYGVSPLIGDIDNACKAYMALAAKQPPDIRLQVSLKDSIGGSDGNTTGPNTTVRVIITQTYSGEVRARFVGSLKREVSVGGSGVLPKLGITLAEVVPTLWELCPYSFLFDYVTNIGDLIGGFATSTAGLRWYWLSCKTIRTRTNYCVPIQTTGQPRTWPLDLRIASGESREFERSKPSLSVSFRDFEFKLPSIKQEVNTAVLAFSKLREMGFRTFGFQK